MDDETMRLALIGARAIAVVGLSNNPSRPSYGVARYPGPGIPHHSGQPDD